MVHVPNGWRVPEEEDDTASGGGLVQRRPVDVFTGDANAAIAARDTYFQTTAPTAINEFVQNRNLAILLRVTQGAGTSDSWQTWIGEDSGTTYDNSMWANRTDAVQGPVGATGADSTVPGPTGPQGMTGPPGSGSARYDRSTLLFTSVLRWTKPFSTVNDETFLDFTKDPTEYETGCHIIIPDPQPTGFDIKVTDGSGTTDDDLPFKIGGQGRPPANAATFNAYLGAVYFASIPTDRRLMGLMAIPEVTQQALDDDATPIVMTQWTLRPNDYTLLPWGATVGPGVTAAEQLFEFVFTDQSQGAAGTRPSNHVDIATGFANFTDTLDDFVGPPFWAVGVEGFTGSSGEWSRNLVSNTTIMPGAFTTRFYPVWAE